jgi:hypothetical protein
MIVAPVPISVPIPLFELRKIVVFAMTFLDPHAIRLILMLIPFMIVIVSGVVVTPLLAPFVVPGFVLGTERRR